MSEGVGMFYDEHMRSSVVDRRELTMGEAECWDEGHVAGAAEERERTRVEVDRLRARLAAALAERDRLKAALREIREHCANSGESEVTRERIIDRCDGAAWAALDGRDEPTGLEYRGG